MSSPIAPHDNARAADPDGASRADDGLSPEELRAEHAGDLPSRDAMSILDVGSIGAGLPVPSDLGETLGSVLPTDELPVPVPPIEDEITPLPIEGLPGDILATDPPQLPVDGGLIGIPQLPTDPVPLPPDATETLA